MNDNMGQQTVIEQTGWSFDDRSCWLCQCVNRPLNPLFSQDDSSKFYRNLIFVCLEIVVVHHRNSDALICVDCIEKLNSFSWFSHQGKSNDQFLKQLPEEHFRVGEQYCRLCLATNGRLHQIFFADGQPNTELCAIIEECTGVVVNCYRDFKSHICDMCRTQLEMFVTFKRICRQIKEKHKLEFSNETDGYGSESLEDETEASLLDILGSENEANEQNTKKKRKRNVQLKNKAKKVKSSPAQTENKLGRTVYRKQVFRMLWLADDERNFEVIKEKKGRAKVYIDGYKFNFQLVNPDGSSVWNCEWKKLHNCKNVVTVSADGKIATFNKSLSHTHGTEPSRLIMCPPGKGSLLKEDGTEENIWLLHFLTAGEEHVRQLVYRGQQYTLCAIYNDKDTSEWVCKSKQCRVAVIVKGIFKHIEHLRGYHIHPELSEQETREILRLCKIRPNSDDVITPFREKNVSEWRNKSNSIEKLVVPPIYTQLASNDPHRNYEVCNIKGNRYKIQYGGYYYKYYLRSVGRTTLWKCIWETIHNCMAMIVVTSDGKQASIYGEAEHSHSTNFAEIFDYELKQYSVRKITSEVEENIQLLSRECLYFYSRSLLHQNHIYNLRLIVNSETRWACVKLDYQRKQCTAMLILNGNFQSFLLKGEHCHPPMSGSEIKHVIRPGNKLELSALTSDEQVSNEDTEQSLYSDASQSLLSMLKQQLLTYPAGRGSIWDKGENKQFSFYFLTDNSNKRENPYKVFYQQYRYSFASIDQHGTSQWICCKLIDTSARLGTCTAHLTIEGIFQRVTAKGSHNHDGIPETMVEYLCSRSEVRT
ncbi:uncharacterized protein LOC131679027 [Topomyia yanbarensis]|uniref:uncharacterized protein LOC131679027 n=1 Tax=Topomyia yanbarensis TaxID=2498891 RepID=UPI00273CE51C|nr:uncharacterized protein LOC131679027 [Topomyia yanbarensis]XP_058815531.1 uncharacterized protein LOC131679027 [Topomyia yanbarensis]